jgi:signal transduction histidine kinase
MSKSNEPPGSERVLICTPFGRDGTLIQKELRASGLTAGVCSSIEELSRAIGAGAGAALIGDEALLPHAIERLASELRNQPPWSDFPLLVMTSGGDTTKASRYRLGLLAPLGNVSLLERPLRTATLVSSLQAALRARRHQYQLAVHLEEREVTAQELKRRNEDLIKANRELEEFAYVSSHDLQEPLRMVNIYTQLLVRRFACENATAQKYAAFIQQGVSRMERLLRDLLTFSRTIHPDGLNIERADLSKSLSQAIFILNGRIEESTAVIQFDKLPTVTGDEMQLAQVFQNLLSNALKYRKANCIPEIVISAERHGEEWIVSVTDNGIGFEQQYAERIFGLFKRLHKDDYPGTGLGLAICQRIVERCGGRIWAEGRPGEGSTFYFALPTEETRGASSHSPSELQNNSGPHI